MRSGRSAPESLSMSTTFWTSCPRSVACCMVTAYPGGSVSAARLWGERGNQAAGRRRFFVWLVRKAGGWVGTACCACVRDDAAAGVRGELRDVGDCGSSQRGGGLPTPADLTERERKSSPHLEAEASRLPIVVTRGHSSGLLSSWARTSRPVAPVAPGADWEPKMTAQNALRQRAPGSKDGRLRHDVLLAPWASCTHRR